MCVCVCVNECVCFHMYVCMYVCMMYVRMYVHVCTRRCVWVCYHVQNYHSLGQDDVIVKVVTSDGHLGTAAMVVAKPACLTPGDTQVHVGVSTGVYPR